MGFILFNDVDQVRGGVLLVVEAQGCDSFYPLVAAVHGCAEREAPSEAEVFSLQLRVFSREALDPFLENLELGVLAGTAKAVELSELAFL